MLRLDNSSQQNPSLWESVLPPELFQMNEELTRVDKLLDDEGFVSGKVWHAHGPADHRGSHLSAHELAGSSADFTNIRSGIISGGRPHLLKEVAYEECK